MGDDMELPGQISGEDDSDVVTDTGFSRGVSGSGRSEVPIVCPPAAAAAATPHAPARNGSKCSGPPGLVDRYPSKASKSSMSELHRAIDCFSSFRIALETNQKHSLRLLDLEMDKLKKLLPQDPSRAYKERLLKPGEAMPRTSRTLRASGVGSPSSPRTSSAALPLPAAAVEAGRHFVDSSPASPASPVSPVSPASPSGSPALAAPKLPQRQRRMSWITKQGTGFLDAKALQELTAEHNLSSEESSPSGDNRGTTYSSEATGRSKAKVKSDAKKNSTSGMLARLDPDLAKDAIRDRAAAEFGKKRVEIMKTEGRLVQLATHPFFERITLAVILFNAAWIGIDIELNKADMLFNADPVFIIMENLFCVFFLAELVIRFGMFKKTVYIFKDIWFMADLILVSLMVLETWLVPVIDAITGEGGGISSGASVLRVARVMRVLRTARMARLVRLMPELMILIKGMMVAFRSVFFTLLLLLLFTYVFSVAFVQFSRDTNLEDPLFFGSMGHAVTTLILRCILTDQESLIRQVAEESWMMCILLLTFILFGSLTVMNMLLGVLVEAIKTVSTIEREQLEVDFAKRVLWDLIDKGEADTDGDNCISEDEYMAVLQKPEAMTALTSLGVDVDAALDYGKLLFEDGEPLTFGDFMKGILTLRGSNQTTVKDIVDLRKFTADEFSHLHEILEVVNQQLALTRAAAGGDSPDRDRRASFSSSRGSRSESNLWS
ncbi:unnamed protein product [Durusdinium trenchii]|uniref:Ion transport domain-containing protein n=1 Tax=Durusdinium trenchii TaxID=1381693 RepID=A0ABP0R9A9_9DINO